MATGTRTYALPQKLESLLSVISKLYANEGERQLQELIVNARCKIELWSSDNWDGGTYGHALFLTLPQPLFLRIARTREALRERIKIDLNEMKVEPNEFFEEVFIEAELEDESQWRHDSGLLLSATRIVPNDAVKRIWNDSEFRLFLSHKSTFKVETHALAGQLAQFGISCFVAHDDIEPTLAWQVEIENALASMDALAAILTSDFHDSEWTDQEVGYAVGRGVPIVPVQIGRVPYGFIGKLQGLKSDWRSAAGLIAKVLIKHDRMFGAYVGALRKCRNFATANMLATVLTGIERLTDQQIDDLVSVFNTNPEIGGSFAFNGNQPVAYGLGLVEIINRLGKRRFKLSGILIKELK